ncbi:hypothetical protein [Flavobacterium cellulosilyticum]|uniref:Lipocalin-like domain-containing protein n=1 Tax=Flavobacterium cellulosilyticum TaxID=2541731 RepID=A0A4R5CFZ8_9FLAO|nr:hypothetical protein [Flavobacterium cellulosilyticum]TDD96172.1 hypothetical protein E0F76_11795 [Flavobacterium cellulosilyticum]
MKILIYFKGIGLLFLLLILTSCTDQNDSNNEGNSLSATWVWVSSSGGIAGVTNTPKSTGNSIELIMTSDFNYTIYTNGSITSQGTYKMSTQKCIHDNTIKNSLIFSNNTEMTIEKINPINILLSDDYYDGFDNLYTRK